ncbi:ABC transporter ATP-binding protein [Peribacillus loiseleuriae]|uniref:Multidrug ABC transporter ATP-binding protein n=1 Tax=Peribacillus loiseleuriae TaxID=1679170 RepID=A0A0K9G508_9BACI|nr:ABC transporter ATP-binding protein [Peribacillus loiseleuriae]KMY41501.1 multidrug ABC transporter ATP-binding protein [Peribacillus loiseleuriae]
MTNVIEVCNVSKAFSGQTILKNIQLKIKKGKTVGIVGGNGSGKSVLFKTICEFIRPDEGMVKIRGEVLGAEIDFPENVGVFINSPGYIEIYSGFKNLQYLAAINKNITDSQIKQTMKHVGLNPDNKTKVKDYSLGMRQKLGIAQAIMENQDILILDEPFNALDYKTYNDIKEIIRSLQATDRTILLTSHHFQDIEELCDEVYFIADGELKHLTEELKSIYFKRS